MHLPQIRDPSLPKYEELPTSYRAKVRLDYRIQVHSLSTRIYNMPRFLY